MRLDRRQKVLLAVLGAVAVMAVVLQVASGGSEAVVPRVASRPARAVGRVAEEQPLVTEVVELRLDLLEPRTGHYTIGRDPWRFGADPAPAAAPPPPPPPRSQTERQEAVKPPPGPPKPRPPSTDHLKYLGSFGPSARRIAVFKTGQEIYLAREGDVLEDKFTVVQIGYESVDVGFVDFPRESAKRLGLGG